MSNLLKIDTIWPIFEFKAEIIINPCLASGRALDEAADDAADPELVALRRRHHVQLSLIESAFKIESQLGIG